MDASRISRRDFLKLLGYGTIAIGIGGILRFGGIKDLTNLFPKAIHAQSSGSWSQGPDTSAVAIHAAILPSGKIFYLAGSGFHRDRPTGPFEARILDPVTNAEQNLALSEDLFCIGLTNLSDGNVLLAGGTLRYDTNPDNCNGKWHGLNAAYEVNGTSGSLDKVSSMSHGRWYPTLVTLTDGKVFCCAGLDEYGVPNSLIEIYDPGPKSWTKKFDPNSSNTYCVGAGEIACAGSGTPCYGGPNNGVAPALALYPRMHLMPSGLVVLCGPSEVFRTWNPSSGIWSSPITQNRIVRSYGTSFLLPLHNNISEKGKILLCGGSISSSTLGIASVDILDFDLGSSTNPVVRNVASINNGRRYLAPIILPTGKLAIFGGTANGNNTNPVFVPEMFDPETETWTTLSSATVPRVYHQVSLLLPDGRVWTAGGTPTSDEEELRTEIYSPDYLFSGPRPVISGSPAVGNYGGNIDISSPNAPDISSVSLVRLMASTHHYDANQRLIWLQIINSNSSSLTVQAPLNSKIAPPGYYMLHILSLGVPSVAKIIKFPGSGGGGGDTTPPAQITGLTVSASSDTQLHLLWTANTEADLSHYNVYRGTIAGFPVTPGTTVPVGQPTTNSFSDSGLAASTTYYYRVAAVDNSGNIGSLSAERSGTTLASIPVFYNVAIPGDGFAGLQAGSSVRYGEEVNTSTSLLVGKSLKTWKVRLRKRNSPSGNITARVRRRSDDAVVATFIEGVNSATLDTSFAEFTFTMSTPYVLQVGDRVMVEYSGPSGIELEVWNSDKFDGANTRRVRYTTSYSVSNTAEVTGSMSSVGSGDTTPPAQVTGLNVSTVNSTQLNLFWTATGDPDLNHYNVYRGTTAGFVVTPGTTIPVGQPTTNSFSDSGLTPSTTYYYRIAAVDHSGNIGPLSALDSAITSNPPDITPPGQVVGVGVSPVGQNQLNLTWTANTESDLSHYNVYRDIIPGFIVTIHAENPEDDTIPVGQPTTNSFSDSGLAASTTYYYKLAAADNSGNIGPLSTEVSGTTTQSNPVFYNVAIPGDGFAGLQAGSSVRYGEEVNTSTSLLVGKSLKTWKVRLRKRNSPSGNITARVRRRSDDAVVATFVETINSATLSTSFAEFTFTMSTPYVLQVGDRVMVEYSGPSGIELEVWNSDKFDGANTRRVRYTTSYSVSNTAEVTGSMSSA